MPLNSIENKINLQTQNVTTRKKRNPKDLIVNNNNKQEEKILSLIDDLFENEQEIEQFEPRKRKHDFQNSVSKSSSICSINSEYLFGNPVSESTKISISNKENLTPVPNVIEKVIASSKLANSSIVITKLIKPTIQTEQPPKQFEKSKEVDETKTIENSVEKKLKSILKSNKIDQQDEQVAKNGKKKIKLCLFEDEETDEENKKLFKELSSCEEENKFQIEDEKSELDKEEQFINDLLVETQQKSNKYKQSNRSQKSVLLPRKTKKAYDVYDFNSEDQSDDSNYDDDFRLKLNKKPKITKKKTNKKSSTEKKPRKPRKSKKQIEQEKFREKEEQELAKLYKEYQEYKDYELIVEIGPHD